MGFRISELAIIFVCKFIVINIEIGNILYPVQTNVAKDIVDTVFKMLKDLDSKPKAENAIDEITGYLLIQCDKIDTFVSNIASNGNETQELIRSLKQNVPTQAIPEQMKNFIAFVREVQFLIEEVKEVNNLEG
jgi:hypothetical protein